MPRYSLNPLFHDFEQNIEQIFGIIDILSVEPQSLNRDTHIEGCFIRGVVAWENFIEEYVLRCMCSAKTRRGTILKPLATCSSDTENAFKKIHPLRKARDKDYLDWLNDESLKTFVENSFHHSSRLQDIYEDTSRLFMMSIIRNAIAHRSKSAISKFQKHAISQFGYLATTNPTMAELLITKKRSNQKLIFKDLLGYYVGLADDLTK